MVKAMMREENRPRLSRILKAVGIGRTAWYRKATPEEDKKPPGPAPKPIPPEVEGWVVEMAKTNPWYGYRRIAVMCRRDKKGVNNRMCYRIMKLHGLLQKPRPRAAELHQAAKLYELLPTKPNALWQMDVTYIHIPGYGWWYAVTVIDYYSRYLLALHLTPSYSATEVIVGLRKAKAEAERLHGPLKERPFLVTDNGSSFLAKRFCAFIADGWTHVRIQYRTPQQLGLLERFHRTLKYEEVYWRIYDRPAHARVCLAEFHERYNTSRPHWALVPEGGGDPVTPEEVYSGGVAIGIPKWQGWAKGAKKKLDDLMAADAASQGRKAS
jgi:RNA-directed DNA polymerase